MNDTPNAAKPGALRRLARWVRARASWQRPRLPFLPLVPSIVVCVGLAIGSAITGLGVEQLQRQSDEAAALQSHVLAATLAERLRATPRQSMEQVVERVVKHVEGEALLVSVDGELVHGGSLRTPVQAHVRQLLRLGEGEVEDDDGRRTRFSAVRLREPYTDLAVIVTVVATDTPPAVASMVESAAAFVVMLVGSAALVAYYLARSFHSDVRYVRDRILAMADQEGRQAVEPIVVRAVDQVGRLTVAFNRLIQRYADAELAYRKDLSRALSYERERSEFLAALSHELRTPMNVILGFTDVLLSEVDGPLSDDARENLEIVRQSGLHLRSLISDILDLSGLETGRVHLSLKLTDIFDVATEVVREKRLTAEQRKLSITLKGEPIHAVADQLRIRQVLGNLVSNAVKFTQTGGVVVHVKRQAGSAAVSVEDTGPGIATEDQAAVFEEYRQSGDWQSRGAGSGLGLAITRRLVRMHGGRIELSSRVGVGSRFTVLLPLGGPPQMTSGGDPNKPRGDTLQVKGGNLLGDSTHLQESS